MSAPDRMQGGTGPHGTAQAEQHGTARDRAGTARDRTRYRRDRTGPHKLDSMGQHGTAAHGTARDRTGSHGIARDRTVGTAWEARHGTVRQPDHYLTRDEMHGRT